MTIRNHLHTQTYKSTVSYITKISSLVSSLPSGNFGIYQNMLSLKYNDLGGLTVTNNLIGKIKQVFTFPTCRSSRPDVICRKSVLRNFSKFTGRHLCQGLFFNKVSGLRPATLLKKRLSYSCFSVNFEKFLRTPFYRTPPVAASGSDRGSSTIFCNIYDTDKNMWDFYDVKADLPYFGKVLPNM